MTCVHLLTRAKFEYTIQRLPDRPFKASIFANPRENYFKGVCDRKILHIEFFKVQYIIIQAILNLQLPMKKYSMSVRLLTLKDNSHADMRTSPAQLLEKGCQHGEEDSKKIFLS